jgi:hypothetical protein
MDPLTKVRAAKLNKIFFIKSVVPLLRWTEGIANYSGVAY